jgi:hypothetical protein
LFALQILVFATKNADWTLAELLLFATQRQLVTVCIKVFIVRALGAAALTNYA